MIVTHAKAADQPLLANRLLFPDVLWQLPQNVYQKRGRLLIVGGSPGYAKPLVEMAEVCLALKAAEVTIALPEAMAETLKAVTEVSIVGLPETPTGSLARSSQSKIVELAGQADLTVFGPSISKQSETQQLAREVIPQISSPLLVADDAVEELTKDDIATRKHPTLLLFDAGSFGRLLKRSGYVGQGERPIVEHLFKEQLSVMGKQARQWQVSLLLTSPEAAVAGVDGRVAVAPDLPSDVLSDQLPLLVGTIAALAAAQPAKFFECAVTALFILAKLPRENPRGALSKTITELEATSEQSPKDQ